MKGGIPVQSWFDDVNDVELLEIIPLLEQLASVESIYSVLRNSNDDIRRSSSPETQNDTSRSSS
uniref:FCP1 homology domain-containing protein n=1 Tax=Parascaris equorum TaxID=6256 RepID=A0A914RR96_PAREQ